MYHQLIRLGVPSALCDVGDSFQPGQGLQLVVLLDLNLYEKIFLPRGDCLQQSDDISSCFLHATHEVLK